MHGAEVGARLDSLRIGAHLNSAQTNPDQESLNANKKPNKDLNSNLYFWSVEEPILKMPPQDQVDIHVSLYVCVLLK